MNEDEYKKLKARTREYEELSSLHLKIIRVIEEVKSGGSEVALVVSRSGLQSLTIVFNTAEERALVTECLDELRINVGVKVHEC